LPLIVACGHLEPVNDQPKRKRFPQLTLPVGEIVVLKPYVQLINCQLQVLEDVADVALGFVILLWGFLALGYAYVRVERCVAYWVSASS
jgi:hypothetical protein